MTRTTRHAVLLCLTALLNAGASCASDPGGDADRGNPGRYDRTGNDSNGGYGRDANPWSSASDRPNRIPRNADVVKEDSGKLRWRADLDGTVYLYDKTADAIRYTGPVRRGDEIMVQPGDDRVSINDRTVGTENLHRDAVHQLYFAADRNRGGYGGGYGRDPDYGRDADRRDTDRRPDRPARRDADTLPGLPMGAERLARGRDGVEFSSAPRNGTVYVYNESTRDVLAQFAVRRGQSVSVAPNKSTVYVDGKAAQKVKIAKGSMLSLHLAGR